MNYVHWHFASLKDLNQHFPGRCKIAYRPAKVQKMLSRWVDESEMTVGEQGYDEQTWNEKTQLGNTTCCQNPFATQLLPVYLNFVLIILVVNIFLLIVFSFVFFLFWEEDFSNPNLYNEFAIR